MREDFGLRVEDADDVHVVRVDGEVDLANADRLQDALVEVAGSSVVADLGGVTFMDSSGIAALLGARRRILDGGNDLVVRGAKGMVRRVFEVTGMEWLLSD